MAQDPTPGIELPTDSRTPSTPGMRNGGFIGIPVVRSTPQLGFALGAVGALLFNIDSASPKSIVGVGGAYSDTQSWLAEIGSRVYFQNGARTGALGFLFFGFNYDFFGVGFEQGNAGQSVGVAQNGDSQMIEYLGRLIGRLYIGPRYVHRGVGTSLRKLESTSPTDTVAILAGSDNSYQVSALGLQGRYDTRNITDEPTNGTLGEIQAMFSRGWLGSDPQFNWYRGWINQYVALSSHQAVLALRLQGCSAGSAAPVWEYCLYGLNSDLRGYSAGRYRDKTMFTGQAEFRIPIVDKFGAVAFGGLGAVEPSFSDLAMDQLLPAGGVGLRYLVWEPWHVKVGADVAWGRNGAAFYLRLGEAY
jgi:hypothetical protein